MKETASGTPACVCTGDSQSHHTLYRNPDLATLKQRLHASLPEQWKIVLSYGLHTHSPARVAPDRIPTDRPTWGPPVTRCFTCMDSSPNNLPSRVRGEGRGPRAGCSGHPPSAFASRGIPSEPAGKGDATTAHAMRASCMAMSTQGGT